GGPLFLPPVLSPGRPARRLGPAAAGRTPPSPPPPPFLPAALPARLPRRASRGHVPRSPGRAVAVRRALALLRARAPSGADARVQARHRRPDGRLPPGSRAGAGGHRGQAPRPDLRGGAPAGGAP